MLKVFFNQMMYSKFKVWKDRGFSPKNIYDIGAHHGNWTRETRNIFPDASFHLFEGCSDNNSRNTEASYHNVLLGKEESVVDFHCVGADYIYGNTGNSIYVELTDNYVGSNYTTRRHPITMLDKYVSSNGIPYPDFIKIDVQGAELDVLEGGKECLKHATMVLLEVSLHRYNAGAPLFAEVVRYMDDHGFEAIDILEMHNIYGYSSLQVDILFAKKGSGFRVESFRT